MFNTYFVYTVDFISSIFNDYIARDSYKNCLVRVQPSNLHQHSVHAMQHQNSVWNDGLMHGARYSRRRFGGKQ